MAKSLVEKSVVNGAEYIVSTEAACVMQLNSFIAENEIPIKAIHLVDLLCLGLQ
jgi:L-lactate dehydrogenase complex protein LldE